MAVKIIRGFFVLACVVLGSIWARYLLDLTPTRNPNDMGWPWMLLGGLLGGGISAVVLFLLVFVTQELYERMAPALVAIVMAMVMGYFVGQYILFWYPNTDINFRVFVVASLVLLFGFVGISLGLTRASNWESLITAVQRQKGQSVGLKLVDTSVIIDGRIADICAIGFIEGTLLVPRFVLKELQNIADSSEVLRRAKGRRGLDILKSLQGVESKVHLEIIDDDPLDVREVDGKLVRLARQYSAKILTNDFNLNKVAQIEGITVLNINDLANALKPAVLPDEQMTVKIIKEGKEASQGVGYLDDGTMVVVDGGRTYMGKTVEVVVTSVLQTARRPHDLHANGSARDLNLELIIPAAGSGTRLKTQFPKALTDLSGKPLLVHTLYKFFAGKLFQRAWIMVAAEQHTLFQECLAEYNLAHKVFLVDGGKERQDSVWLGLSALPATTDIVLIHDAARPFVSQESIQGAVDAAEHYGAATVAIPAVDTILEAGADGFLEATPDRARLWYCQTPQAFRYDIAVLAHRAAQRSGFTGTDDASLVRRMGGKVRLVQGTPFNFKITAPMDLTLARLMIKEGIA